MASDFVSAAELSLAELAFALVVERLQAGGIVNLPLLKSRSRIFHAPECSGAIETINERSY
ncbi:hypothetical protein ACKZDW_10395 [Ralstonia syzygii subsp. celebesensis]